MRATQFVGRGLIAFATVAALSVGLAGVAGAEGPGAMPGTSPGASTAGGDAIVWVPVPGYSYQVVNTPDGQRSSLLLIGGPAASAPVAVQFLPDIHGAAVYDPTGNSTVIAPRP
jgi:hypothetical protein